MLNPVVGLSTLDPYIVECTTKAMAELSCGSFYLEMECVIRIMLLQLDSQYLPSSEVLETDKNITPIWYTLCCFLNLFVNCKVKCTSAEVQG